MPLLTMQTAHLFTLPSPARAAIIDCVQIHVVHLPVHCVVGCPEKEKFCYSHRIVWKLHYRFIDIINYLLSNVYL